MSISSDPQPTNPGELQFDQADYTADSLAAQSAATCCAACKAPIVDTYFESGGKILCATCRDRIETAARRGAGITGVLKALVFGTIGAAIGAFLYYAIMRITGLNIGLVAVVVGVLVGGAVRAGSGNRGGKFYQFLAVFLTYSAIAAMYIPDMMEAIQRLPERGGGVEAVDANGKQAPAEKAKPEAGKKDAPAPVKGQAEAGTKDEAPAAKATVPPPGAQREPPSLGKFLFAAMVFLVFLIGFTYSIPVVIAINSPISGLIFGFALWEAWKINRKVRLAFNGPFSLPAASAPTPETESGEAGDAS
jgi:hypothetical protein